VPPANLLAAEVIREASLYQSRKNTTDPAEAPWKVHVPKKSPLRKLFEAAYQTTGNEPLFSKNGVATPAAQAMLEQLKQLPSHGVKLDAYPVGRVEAALANLATFASAERAEAPTGLDTLVRLIVETPADADAGRVVQDLRAAGLNDQHIESLAAAREVLKRQNEKEAARAAAVFELDTALLEAFFRYEVDFRQNKVAHPFRALRNPESIWSTFHDKIMEDFKSADFGDLANTLRSWWPRNPQYELLRVSLAFYERLAAESTQPVIPNGTYKRGAHGEAVKTIQARLRQEGYFAGEDTGEFDEALDAAVKKYQETHQLDQDGVVGGTTTKSMNVVYAERAEQIRLGLQRWRESDARFAEGYYFRVNLPQFEVELWNNHEFVRRHRVVIGSNAWEKDPDRGIEGHLNRTMLFSDEMETVVLNPMWHVPKRIKETELDVEAAKTEGYWEKHNYQVEVMPDGTERVFQRPGPGNALGMVKFLFPNEFSIYMHDTPKKKLFDKTLRAFSHGCIRVHQPLDLARYLLVEKDQRLTNEEFDAIMKRGEERGMKLRSTIPVHLDYNTVAVDDSGHVRFFSDIYQYDKAYRDGRVPLPKQNYKVLDG
jgi:murein L,D-transpeptidase YcbB/YkuD